MGAEKYQVYSPPPTQKKNIYIYSPSPKNFKKAQPPENIPLQNSPALLKSGGFIP